MASPFFKYPRAVPDKSNSVTMPGSEAVSPPARVTRARRQASANEAPRAACTSGSGLGTAT